MILIFTDNTWTMMSSAWSSGNDPSTANTTEVSYGWAEGGAAQGWTINVPVGHAAFLKYLRDNVDANGFCDIRSLQGGRP